MSNRDVATCGVRSRGRPMKVFAPFCLDAVNQCLWRRGDAAREERILLTPKAFAVLTHLVEHAGRLVTHDQGVRWAVLRLYFR
jgi:DNA-binding response OmpR family regulator